MALKQANGDATTRAGRLRSTEVVSLGMLAEQQESLEQQVERF